MTARTFTRRDVAFAITFGLACGAITGLALMGRVASSEVLARALGASVLGPLFLLFGGGR